MILLARLAWSWKWRGRAIRLEIFDVTGRRVVRAFDDAMSAGTRVVTCNLRGLEPGFYLARMEALGRRITRRLVLLR